MARIVVLVAGGLLVVCAAAAALVLSEERESTTERTTSADPPAIPRAFADALREDAPDAVGDAATDEPSGYSGTAHVRRRGGRRRVHVGPDHSPPDHKPWVQRFFPDDAAIEGVAAALHTKRDYRDLLWELHRVAGKTEEAPSAAGAEAPPVEVTRFQTEPERVARLLKEALDRATVGVVRQSLIFHMAIGLPPEHVRPSLWSLVESGEAADAADALCALAFTGDPDAMTRFASLPPDPGAVQRDPVIDSNWDADELYVDGRRDLLRAYRCIEALDGTPYFHRHGIWLRETGIAFPWARARAVPAAVSEQVLPAWMNRFPGHAGTDDMSYRMAQIRLGQGRAVEALHWASRGATEPDGDMQDACVATMISIVELAEPGAPETEHVIDPAAPDRCRELLLYLRLRRRVQDHGYVAGLRELESIAGAERDLVLSRAWRERWSAPVPRGLHSGTYRFPDDDWLLRVEDTLEGADSVHRYAHGRHAIPMVDPPERLDVLRLEPLRRQVRAWETLAELERRTARASTGDEAELLYKQGAIHYHDRDVLYPAYALHDERRSGRPRSVFLTTSRSWDEHDRSPDAAWLRGVLSWDNAIERFEMLLQLHPDDELADDALYSIALAHVKAADDRAVRALSWSTSERERHLAAAVTAFETLIAQHPDSRFRPESEAAMRYWRRARPELF